MHIILQIFIILLLSSCSKSEKDVNITEPESTVEEITTVSDKKITHTVYFEFDSDEITNEEQKKLSQLIKKVSEYDYFITFEGHTDNRGSEAYNEKLSERRAKSVQNFINQYKNVKIIAYGEKVLPGGADNHAANRIVTIKLDQID